MTKLSEKFEKQISRTHELIEQPGSVVTWDDHIPDPDNPSQLRQIDITIRREESLTIIECRIHKEPQDVTWIEELIGRKISLNADTVIAVSHSGFTIGAIKKAKNFGVILRDFRTLTDEEIKQWGHKTTVWVTYHNFSNLSLSFFFDKRAEPYVTADKVLKYLTNEGYFSKLIEHIIGEIDKRQPERFAERKSNWFIQLFPEKGEVDSYPIKEVIFNSDYRLLKMEARIPSVVAYDGPEIDALERVAKIENVNLGVFEITQSSDEVTVALDFNQIGIPMNSRIRTIDFDFKRPVKLRSFEFLAQPKIFIPLENFNIEVLFR